ncbi:MAG: AtpZ/AtpI family protein [Oscillospiraceae bacterium]|jgi:ATP synthase protein I
MKDENRRIVRALGLMTQLGLTMACCVLIGVLAGRFLDSKLGTSPWLLVLFSLVGGAAAMKVMYDLVIKEEMK